MKKHNQEHPVCGETLPQNVQVYRIKVVSTFLHAGVPLSKVSYFRELLGLRLTDRRHLFDCIPYILTEEECRLGMFRCRLMAQRVLVRHWLKLCVSLVYTAAFTLDTAIN